MLHNFYTKWTTHEEREKILSGKQVFQQDLYVCPICDESVYTREAEAFELHKQECKEKIREKALAESNAKVLEERARIKREAQAEIEALKAERDALKQEREDLLRSVHKKGKK